MFKKIADFSYQTLLLFSGCILCTFSIKALILPHDLLSRGLTGLALMIYYQWAALPLGVIYLLINIPVFVLGWRFVSGRFIAYSLWGMTIYSLALSLIDYDLKISDPMLAVMMGGALYGLGAALVLRSYGSSGGSDILCVALNKLFSITLGTGAILVNMVVLLPGVLFFPLERIGYTLVFIFISGFITNMVFHGMAKRRTAIIVSGEWKAIAEALKSHRIGVTLLSGQGGYLGVERTLLYSVLFSRSVPLMKRVVAQIDPAAFISIMEADDVTGVEVGNQPHW